MSFSFYHSTHGYRFNLQGGATIKTEGGGDMPCFLKKSERHGYKKLEKSYWEIGLFTVRLSNELVK